MATVSAVILKDDVKSDGTWNVKIRVWHNNKPAYIETTHFVGKKQVGKKNKSENSPLVIKDSFILDRVAPDLKRFRDWISDHAEEIESVSARELRDSLVDSKNAKKKATGIDFVSFSDDLFERMRKMGKGSSTKSLVTVINSLKDYFRSDSINIEQITYNFLLDYELYLKGSRKLVRYNAGKSEHNQTKEGLNKLGLHNHMRDLRLLFNKARMLYNDEEKGIIKIAHYPFAKYKVGKAPRTAKRTRPVTDVIKIRDCVFPARTVRPGARERNRRDVQARDLFMLSFYMLGMNAKDMFELPTPDKIGVRYQYERSKTRGRREDNALISVLVVPEARVLFDKYAGKLQLLYSSDSTLNNAIDLGLALVSKATGIPNIDFYDARHCVGDWARNLLHYRRDDVAEAMNHVDDMTAVTDIYISKDWSLLDRVQRDLINLLK